MEQELRFWGDLHPLRGSFFGSSLFGRWRSSAFRLITPIFRSRARASLRDQPLALPAWDQQEETEQSDSRTDRGRAIDTTMNGLLSDGMAVKSKVSKLFTAEKCAAGMWRSTMR